MEPFIWICHAELVYNSVHYVVSFTLPVQDPAADLVGQLPSAGGARHPEAEARAGRHGRDELPDRVGRREQLARLPASPQRAHDPGDHDAPVQRLWPGLRLDPDAGHEHRGCVYSKNQIQSRYLCSYRM